MTRPVRLLVNSTLSPSIIDALLRRVSWARAYFTASIMLVNCSLVKLPAMISVLMLWMLISVPVVAVDKSIVALSGFCVDQNLLVKHHTTICLLKLLGYRAQKESQNLPLAGDQSVTHLCSCFVALYTYYSTTGLFGQITL